MDERSKSWVDGKILACFAYVVVKDGARHLVFSREEALPRGGQPSTALMMCWPIVAGFAERQDALDWAAAAEKLSASN